MQPEFHLTPEESALVTNGNWLLTKQRVIGKVYGMFGMLSEKYGTILEGYQNYIPSEVLSVPPKIYKGEMYRQLPYVMLDHPRYFDQQHVFALRNFFWWGNHFSIHLVLAGKYKEKYQQAFNAHINEGALDHWYIGVSDDPWEHHFEEDNYQPIHVLRSHKNLPQTKYLKLARWHPLDEWQDAYPFFLSSCSQLMECIA